MPFFGRAEACTEKVDVVQPDDPPVVGAELGPRAPVHPHVPEVAALGQQCAADHAGYRATDDDDDDHDGTTRAVEQRTLATAAELVSVAPRRELRPHGPSDPHELETLRVLRQAHVLRRHANPSVPEEPLAHLHRLPPLLERGEVPALALAADDPETAPLRVEGQPTTHGEVLDHLILTEWAVAEHESLIHRGSEREVVMTTFTTDPVG